MKQADLIAAISTTAGINKAEASRALQALVGIVADAMASGDKVVISKFGTFQGVERAARTANNPSTGEKLQVPARTAPVFRPAPYLKAFVADGS